MNQHLTKISIQSPLQKSIFGMFDSKGIELSGQGLLHDNQYTLRT